jgi:transcription elongation GreA/GreB family factor
MPELGKITIDSDLGRILLNARVGDLMDTPLGIIRIVEVVNTLASISKGASK